MFYRAALDIMERDAKPNRRFYSCVRFVSDSCTPAVFYLNAEWWKRDVLGRAQIDIDNLSPQLVDLLKKHDAYPDNPQALDSPALVYLIEGSWNQPEEPETGARAGIAVPKREFVLSTSPVIHRAHLADSGLNAQTAILCLASVGLDVMLPNVSFDLLADEEIERLKEEFAGERLQYLEVMSGIAEQAYDRLKNGDYVDTMRWAESEVAFKLGPKARILEAGVAGHTSRQLRAAGYSFWKDGVPVIGAAYMTGGPAAATVAAGQEALRAVVSAISSGKEERSLPEVAYAMKIKRSVGVANTL